MSIASFVEELDDLGRVREFHCQIMMRVKLRKETDQVSDVFFILVCLLVHRLGENSADSLANLVSETAALGRSGAIALREGIISAHLLQLEGDRFSKRVVGLDLLVHRRLLHRRLARVFSSHGGAFITEVKRECLVLHLRSGTYSSASLTLSQSLLQPVSLVD